MPIIWNQDLELHIKIIDLQHQQLIKVTNQLLEALNHPIPDSTLYSIFQEVIRYSNYHFKTEEFFLEKFHCDPEQTKVHIAEHHKFKENVQKFFELSKINNPQASFNLINLLENWLIHHIPHVDKKYVDCFHKNKLY